MPREKSPFRDMHLRHSNNYIFEWLKLWIHEQKNSFAFTLLQTSAEVCTDFAEVLTLGSAPFLFRAHTLFFLMNKKTCRQWALQGRHSCIAQGGMRAKPDMKPWVHTKRKVIWAPSGAALSARAFVLDRVVPPLRGSSTSQSICFIWCVCPPSAKPKDKKNYQQVITSTYW